MHAHQMSRGKTKKNALNARSFVHENGVNAVKTSTSQSKLCRTLYIENPALLEAVFISHQAKISS